MTDSAVAIEVKPIVQEACNKSAAIAAKMATFPLSRNIFLMVTNKVPFMLFFNFTGSIPPDPVLHFQPKTGGL